MHAIAHRGYGHRKRACTEGWLWEKNPLPHRRIEPASAACPSNTPPTELHCWQDSPPFFLYQYILLPHVLPIHCHMLSYTLSPFTCLLVTHCQERVASWILITCEILPQTEGTPNAVYLYIQTCIFKNKKQKQKKHLWSSSAQFSLGVQWRNITVTVLHSLTRNKLQ